jgi:hypothetical protein
MTVVDYSGVRADGRSLRKTGWSFFSVGVLFALCAVVYVGAILLVVLSFVWTMGHFGS